MGAYVYILRCADDSYYVGSTGDSLESRIAEHDAGTFDGYTALRRPVTLVLHQEFVSIEDAIAAERQVKGFAALPALSRRAASPSVRPSSRASLERSSR
jgi:putative endonuclease